MEPGGARGASGGGPGPSGRPRVRSVGPGGAPEVTMGRVRRGHALPGERRGEKLGGRGRGRGLRPARPARRFSGCIHPSVRLSVCAFPSHPAAGQAGSGAHPEPGHRAVGEGLGTEGTAWPCGCWELPQPQLCPATDTGSAKHGVAMLSVQCNVKYKAVFGRVHLVGFCAFYVPVPRTRAEEHQRSCILHVLSLLHRNRHRNTRFSCFYLTT